ncbi:MAG: hypothetical protein RLZZ300_1104, partial [Pseudomonadota bacterium]
MDLGGREDRHARQRREQHQHDERCGDKARAQPASGFSPEDLRDQNHHQ